jgi:hypothetical protein
VCGTVAPQRVGHGTGSCRGRGRTSRHSARSLFTRVCLGHSVKRRRADTPGQTFSHGVDAYGASAAPGALHTRHLLRPWRRTAVRRIVGRIRALHRYVDGQLDVNGQPQGYTSLCMHDSCAQHIGCALTVDSLSESPGDSDLLYKYTGFTPCITQSSFPSLLTLAFGLAFGCYATTNPILYLSYLVLSL